MGTPKSNDRSAGSDRLRSEVIAAKARGWALTPLNGKAPKRRAWQKEAPMPLAKLLEYVQRGDNVGIRTGRVSGIVILDDDTPDQSAGSTWALPETVTALTGSGKHHYYFRIEKHQVVKRSKPALNTDLLGECAQAVFPGSLHPDTGEPYSWKPGLGPDDVPFAPLPEELLVNRVESKKKRKRGERRPTRSAPESCIEAARAAIMDAAVGERNEILNRRAFLLGGLMADREWSREEIAKGLEEAALSVGLDAQEVERTIRSGLDAGSTKARERPVLIYSPGDLGLMTEKVLDRFSAERPRQLFSRGGGVVRVSKGQLPIVSLRVGSIREEVSRVFRLRSINKSGEEVPIPCPRELAEAVLGRQGRWSLPELRVLRSSPTLTPAGEILRSPGWDRTSEIFMTSRRGYPVPTIPKTPEQARELLEPLLRLISGFPFAKEHHRSSALAAMFTAAARPAFPTAPLFAFTSPTPGTGKSLLADLVSVVSVGAATPAFNLPNRPEEIDKTIFAAMLGGKDMFLLDNIAVPLNSHKLCSVLTQETCAGRVLGVSSTAEVDTCVTWLATGNNLQITGDLPRRCLRVLLDAEVERPEEREFHGNLIDKGKELHPRALMSILGVLKGFKDLGMPGSEEVRAMGSFADWSRWVRGALLWMGFADPFLSQIELREQNSEDQTVAAFLECWYVRFGSQTVVVTEASEAMYLGGAPPAWGGKRTDLGTAYFSWKDDSDPPSPKRFGMALASIEDRPLSNLVLRSLGRGSSGKKWRVEKLGGPENLPSDTCDTSTRPPCVKKTSPGGAVAGSSGVVRVEGPNEVSQVSLPGAGAPQAGIPPRPGTEVSE